MNLFKLPHGAPSTSCISCNWNANVAKSILALTFILTKCATNFNKLIFNRLPLALFFTPSFFWRAEIIKLKIKNHVKS